MEHSISISVIIPGHNCSSTIDKTLQSIGVQSIDKKNLEIIYVDDGSTDESISKVKIFKKRSIFPVKIISFSYSSGGPSKARNIGIKNAKNDYIFFIDSDDFIEKDCLQKLLSKVDKDNYPDYIVGLHYQIRRSNDKKLIKNINNCGIKNKKEIYQNSFLANYFNNYCKYTREYCLFEHCWGRLIKTSLIKEKNIAFEENMNQLEDILFNSKVLTQCNQIEILNEPIYNHVLYGSNERLSLKSGEDQRIIEDLKKVSFYLSILYKKLISDVNGSLSNEEFIGYFLSSKIINYIVRISIRNNKKINLTSNLKKFRDFYLKNKLYIYRCWSKDESYLIGILIRLKFTFLLLKIYLNIRKHWFFRIIRRLFK